MLPHGQRIVRVHSAVLTEDEQDVQLWLWLDDRSLVCCYVSVAELSGRAHVIDEQECERPAGARLH